MVGFVFVLYFPCRTEVTILLTSHCTAVCLTPPCRWKMINELHLCSAFCLAPCRIGGLEVGWRDIGITLSVCLCVFLTKYSTLGR